MNGYETDPKRSEAAYIHARKLPAFTGLSEARIRQLTDAGLIPEPIDGYYELQPTVKAIIDYYRKKARRRISEK